MKIQIKQAMTLIENETGGYSAEVRNIFIDGNKIIHRLYDREQEQDKL